MNNNHRIGVFDSGIGGLGFVRHMRKLMPDEDIYYFADTVNNPYGEKSAEEIEKYLVDIIEGMLLRQVKLLVIACNTASAVFIDLPEEHYLKKRLKEVHVDVIPITGFAGLSTLPNNIEKALVVATKLTVESGIYFNLIKKISPDTTIISAPAPEWVERVENPDSDSDKENELRKKSVANILSTFADDKPDAIILGCTHFSSLKPTIKEYLEESIIVDPALSVAKFVKSYLAIRTMEASRRKRHDESLLLFTNGNEQKIRNQIDTINLDTKICIKQVDIRNDFSGKTVDIVGLGVTGESLVRYLQNHKPALLRLRDKNLARLKDLQKTYSNTKFGVFSGGNYLDQLESADVVFRSPGVPANLPEFTKVKKLGIPIMGDIELFLKNAKGKKVAITGTNGKTTTTLLTQKLFEQIAGKNSVLVGNVGKPVLDIVETLNDESFSAIELSSFQLEELGSLPVDISIILNITPDHLDRHGDMHGYIKAKGQILRLLNKNAFAIYNFDSEPIVNELLTMGCKAQMHPFSLTHELEIGASFCGDDFVLRSVDKKELRLENYRKNHNFTGTHNFENIMAASLAAYLLDLDHKHIKNVLTNFAGVKYRIEHFYRLNNVDYFDDSKGTNPDATIKAFDALNSPIRLVAGGNNKGYGFDEIASFASKKVRSAYLFGEIAESFKTSLENLKIPIKSIVCNNLEEATKAAFNDAQSGDAVLFSPACASPTGIKYYQRGNEFKKIVASCGDNEQKETKLYLDDPLACK